MSQLNLALFLAVLNNQAELDETIVCLSGTAGGGHLDMLHITTPGRHLPRFRKHDVPFVATRDFARVVEIALRFAVEGREGAPIGTIFVLGDVEELSPYLRQLVLNPCKGHLKKERNIHNPELLETLREFSAMDGAFIITKGGTVESAGTYLDAPVRKAKLRAGLGARHAAALAITAQTEATAVVLSSSSGDVTVFHEGKPILELERPLSESPESALREGRKPRAV
jgi:DNA integrity scanning protein DisA with diadenylate cyclase activity